MSGEGYQGPAQYPHIPWWKRIVHWWMGRR